MKYDPPDIYLERTPEQEDIYNTPEYQELREQHGRANELLHAQVDVYADIPHSVQPSPEHRETSDQIMEALHYTSTALDEFWSRHGYPELGPSAHNARINVWVAYQLTWDNHNNQEESP